jgi:L-ascorbate metabolism protein UlaG (beta-lactamase superfamily)
MPIGNDVKLTWFGHATFMLESPGGKRILIDPFLTGNPSCPDDRRDPGDIDLMLISHGHADHTADAVELATSKKPAAVVGIVELCGFLEGKGVENCIGMNKGGTHEVAPGIRVTLTHAFHSSSIPDGDQNVYTGEPVGFIIELENGYRVYFAGDTCIFGDMALIGDLYRPELALLPIGDFFTMGPREAAKAIELLGVTKVVPMHYGTFPLLTGTPERLRQEAAGVQGLEVLDMQPGETIT